MARTDTLTNFLTDVASAIKTKKGSQTDILASNFDTEIANLPSGGGDPSEYFNPSAFSHNPPNIAMQIKKAPPITIDNSYTVPSLSDYFSGCYNLEEADVSGITKTDITIMQGMFYNCQKLTTIKGIASLPTSNVTNMSNMFAYCYVLPSIDLSGFSTSNVTKMAGMFNNCQTLNEQTTDFSLLNTTKVTDFSTMFTRCYNLKDISLSNIVGNNPTKIGNMFSYCSNLESVSLPNLTSNALTDVSSIFYSSTKLESVNIPKALTGSFTSMNSIFRNCTSLKTIDMPNFSTSASSVQATYMFYGCSSLERIDLRSLDWTKMSSVPSNVFADVPNDCLIIVADQTQKDWFANGSQTSRFTNVKTVAEL